MSTNVPDRISTGDRNDVSLSRPAISTCCTCTGDLCGLFRQSGAGAARTATLHAAGRLTGTPEAVARLASVADLPDEPYNLLGF